MNFRNIERIRFNYKHFIKQQINEQEEHFYIDKFV